MNNFVLRLLPIQLILALALSPTSILTAQNTAQLDQWTKAINNTDTQAIQKAYRSDALVILTPESVIEGNSSISKYWQDSNHKILNPESLFHTVARENRGIEYELVTYSTSNGKSFTQLLIWQKTADQPSRQLEYTVRVTGDYKAENEKDIEGRRLEWIKLCNEHNARNLVESLYSANTLYYNHKPLVKGREDVIHEYGYMNNERYSLSLHPLHIEYPSADTAIEIGQCKGSYGGKYILVWKKESDGIWRIMMDSNV